MYDEIRDNTEHHEGGGFIVGLLMGAALGVGLGMLLAPKAGADLRGELGEQARNLGAKAAERYPQASERASGLVEHGREIANQTRDAVNRGAEEVRDFARGSADTRATPGSFDGGSASNGGASGPTADTAEASEPSWMRPKTT
jgi:gas vesicle protein